MKTTITDIIKYSLDMFSISICLKVGDKIILLNPSILKDVNLDTVAEHLYNANLTDDEIISALEAFENAKENTKIPDSRGPFEE